MENQESNKIAKRFFDAFLKWRGKHLPDIPFLFVLAFAVGLVTGFGAFLLKTSIGALSRFLTSHFTAAGFNPWLLGLPVAGMLLCGLFMRYVLHADISHGVRQMIGRLHRRDYNIRPSGMVSAFIASTITLSFGGSAGSEGPIACTGAAVGSNLGRAMGLKPGMVKILLGCGAGAGIAGIFKAPIGGVLFTLEVLQMGMTTMSVLALVVCCLTSGLTAYVLGGCTVDIPFARAAVAFETSELGWIFLLGVFCGLYSAYYNYAMKKTEHLILRIGSLWMRSLVTGLALGVMLFLFPVLYGEGYSAVGHIINGHGSVVLDGIAFDGLKDSATDLVLVAAGIIGLKCFATAATTNGGVAGDFAPTLFAGAVAGLGFALLANSLFRLDLTVGNYALYAMAGVMAGTIRAPLMAIFLVVEMTDSYACLIPVVIVAAVSFGVIRLFNFHKFYSTKI